MRSRKMLRPALVLATAFLIPACGGGGGSAPPPPGSFFLLAPVAGQAQISALPTFAWEPSSGAVSYTIEVSDSNTFSNVIILQTGIAGTVFVPSSPLALAAQYYWRVTAFTDAGGSRVASGSPAVFVTESAVPPAGRIVAGSSRLYDVDRATLAQTPLTGPGFDWGFTFYGLTYDPAAGILYACTESELVQIDPATGSASKIGDIGYCRIQSIAFDSNSGILYAATSSRALLSVDPATGISTYIGNTGSLLTGMTYDPTADVLYAIHDPSGDLFTVDTATGASTSLFSTPPSQGLALDPNTGLLHGIYPITRQLFTLDPVTQATTFGGFVPTGMVPTGLAFDTAGNRMLGVLRGILYEIATPSGTMTRITPAIAGPIFGNLAYDPAANVLYGINGIEMLQQIDPYTGAVTTVGPTGLVGTTAGISGATFDPDLSVLYVTDRTDLYTVNPGTGQATFQATIGATSIQSLAYDPTGGVLYGNPFLGQEIVTIDVTTGNTNLVGTHTISGLAGMAFDAGSGTLFGTSVFQDPLYTIDTTTGASTPVDPAGEVAASGLAFSSTDNRLYSLGGGLVRIDPATGGTTPVNWIGYTFDDFAYDSANGILYALASRKKLLRIDMTTWTAIPIGNVDVSLYGGIAFDPNSGLLFASGTLGQGVLQTIDPVTATGTPIGPVGQFLPTMTYHPGKATLYAMDIVGANLLSIDMTTGTPTTIGSTGFIFIDTIAYDPQTQMLLGYSQHLDQMVSIDPDTAVTTPLGRTTRCLTPMIVID